MDFDELWVEPKGGPRSWYSYLDDDAQAWLGELAGVITARGSEPFWKPTHERFQTLFPDAKPSTVDTIRTTVRRLLRESL